MHISPRLFIAPPDTIDRDSDQSTGRRLQGEVAHQALALLEPGETRAADVLRRLRQARTLLGLHPNETNLESLVPGIVRSLAHPLVAALFAPGVSALAEQEIVVPSADNPDDPHKLLRVDRLALLPDGTLKILDFKLGPGDPTRDRAQVRSYQRLLADIFGRSCHGALVNLDMAEAVALAPVHPKPRDLSGQPCPESDLVFESAAEFDTTAGSPVPIRVFPLRANLIALLHDALLGQYRADAPLEMARIQVVFPHRRPRLHLHHHLARSIRRPFLPPRCLSLEDWVLRQASLSADAPPALASLLDQAWLLHDIHREIESIPAAGDESSAWHRFLPWGMRLAQVLDELDRELVTAGDLIHPPEDLPELARDLLGSLGAVQSAFHVRLAARNLTTPAALAKRIAPEQTALDSPMYLCGLFALTRSEAQLVQNLRVAGARLWWQANAPLPEQLARWARHWQADLDWAPDEEIPGAAADRARKTTFVVAHDLHSELRHMAGDAATWGTREQVAVILPNPALLRPVLAHLPATGAVNVTLGMPLERSALGVLLHTLVRMAGDRQITGVGPKSRDYLDLWQNPWVRGLLPEGTMGRLRQAVQGSAKTFLNAQDMALLMDLLQKKNPELDGQGQTILVDPVDLAALFHEALDLDRLDRLCAYLKKLLNALRVREKTPSALEAHMVHALLTGILPRLEQALCREETLPCAALWGVFWNCLRMERAPFNGEPLTPWQVMGLLESRLMCFDKVVLLECVEGVLPAAGTPNPLLPEAVRPALGLPPGHGEEQIVRHHVQRLTASAGEVRLYARHGLSPNPLEGWAVPSRYWEQEIWAEEKQQNALLKDRITRVPLNLDLGLTPGALPDKASVLPLLRRRLQDGLSLSALNTYLSCPVRFFNEHVARFPQRFDAGRDPAAAAMGDLAHIILERLLRPYVHKSVALRNLLPDFEILWRQCVPQALRNLSVLPASRHFHVRLLRELLINYLRKTETPVQLLGLEEPLRRSLPGRAATILLKGRLDRVDRDVHTGLPLILDYKTGSAPLDKPLNVSRLRALADAMEETSLNETFLEQEGLVRIKEELRDLQLPGYLYLYNQPALCGFVLLGEWNTNKNFISLVHPGKKDAREEILHDFLDWQTHGLPAILEWIGRHILEAPRFYPASQAQTCTWCPWRSTCPWALDD